MAVFPFHFGSSISTLVHWRVNWFHHFEIENHVGLTICIYIYTYVYIYIYGKHEWRNHATCIFKRNILNVGEIIQFNIPHGTHEALNHTS